MSWLFSQALVEEYLGAVSLGGEPYARWNKTLTAVQSSPNGKTTDFSRLSRSGVVTFETSGATFGEELLMWFLGGFPARTFRRREAGADSKVPKVDSGERWRALSLKFDQGTYSWKTHGSLFDEDLTPFSAILPQWGSMHDGELWELMIAVLPTSERDFGLWPTPCQPGNGGTHGKAKLKQMLWPTPRTTGLDGGSNSRKAAKERGMWPTPLSRDSATYAKAKWGANSPGGTPLPVAVGGTLNPTWVEWLMGWPIGWTDLKPLATDKFQEWLQLHGEF